MKGCEITSWQQASFESYNRELSDSNSVEHGYQSYFWRSEFKSRPKDVSRLHQTPDVYCYISALNRLRSLSVHHSQHSFCSTRYISEQMKDTWKTRSLRGSQFRLHFSRSCAVEVQWTKSFLPVAWYSLFFTVWVRPWIGGRPSDLLLFFGYHMMVFMVYLSSFLLIMCPAYRAHYEKNVVK